MTWTESRFVEIAEPIAAQGETDGQSLRSEGEKGKQEMTTRSSLVPWTLANGIGMALGFLAFIQTLMFLGFGLDFGSHWSVADVEALESTIGSDSMERLLRLGLVTGLPLAGLLFATSQAWVLRRFLPRLWFWVLTGPAGFAAMILVIWPFTAIWGDIPGPVEPLTIVGGGMLATGVLQWLLLRRRGVHATRWLTLWLLGLPLGMLVTTAVIVGAGETVGYPPWPLEVALIGFFVGGTAAGLSGRALLDRIGPPARAGDVPERKADVAN